MSRLTLQEYLNERIKNVEYYIEFNERKDDKDFFAHKELELCQMAQKYMLLTDELGCPLDVVFKALKQSEIYSIDECFEDLSLAVNCGGWYLWNAYGGFLYLKDYKKTWWLSSDLEE